MEQKTKTNETRLFLTALLLLFITLKLCKVIDWSWWWVLSPFWIPLSIAIFFLLISCALKSNDKKENEQKGTTSNWNARLKAMQDLQKQRRNT